MDTTDGGVSWVSTQSKRSPQQYRATVPVAGHCGDVDNDIARRRYCEQVRDDVSGPVEMVLLKNSYHMITIDNDRCELISRSVDFINHHVPPINDDCLGESQEKVVALPAAFQSSMLGV